MSGGPRHPLGIGSVLSDTCALAARHPVLIFLPFLAFETLILGFEASVLGIDHAQPVDLIPDPDDVGTSATVGLGSGGAEILYLLCYSVMLWILGAWVALEGYWRSVGRASALAESARTTLANLGPIILLGTFYSLVVLVGLLAFVGPGLYLAARYWTYPLALLVEDTRYGAMTRASDLTEGARAAVLGAALLVLGLCILVAIGAGAVIGLVSGNSVVDTLLLGGSGYAVAQVVSATLISGLMTAFTATLYGHLRLRETPVAADDLSEVFA